MTRGSSKSKGSSQPGGHDRRSEKGKKDSEKRKHSGNTPSGFTPDSKKMPDPDLQVKETQVKPAEPQPVSDTSTGKASTSENTLVTSKEAADKLGNLSLIAGGKDSESEKAAPMDGVEDEVTEEEMNELLDSDEDEDMSDLDEKAEEEIAKDELGVKKDDKPTEKTYAAVASKADNVRGFEVLYIHTGVKERSPITEDDFYKLWDRIDYKTMDKMLEDEAVPGDGVLWKKWTQGRGLICVKDQESSDFVKELVSETKVKGKSFKAWKRGDFGEGRRVTGYLKGNAHKGRSGDQLMKLLLKYNRLVGKHTGVLMKDTDQGRELHFFANPEMWKDLVSRLPNKRNPRLRLKLGLGMPMFKLWREKTSTSAPKASTGASNQSILPVATTSTDDAGETVPGKPEEAEEGQEPKGGKSDAQE